MSARRGALTPVALRAPSVSAPRTGTFYFAQNRKFLLCLDSRFGIHWKPMQRSPQARRTLCNPSSPVAVEAEQLCRNPSLSVRLKCHA